MSKEAFKEFVRKNPKLISYVKNNEMTWQGFYELYDLYGEEEETWKPYLINEERKEAVKNTATSFGMADLVNWLKTVNLDSLQDGIGNVQRVLGIFQDFSKKDTKQELPKNEYKPRPLYKHFED